MATVKVDVKFSDNVAELKDRIAAGIGTIDVMKQSVDRCAASIGGQGLFMQANKLTAAIDQVGGVTKLTSAEMERHSATLDKAIEKYNVMGMTAPPTMVALAESIRKPADAADDFKSRLEAAFKDPMGAIQSLGSSLQGFIDMLPVGVKQVAEFVVGIGTTVGVLLKLGNDAELVGATIGRMGQQFNIPVENVSNLRFAVTAAGGDFETFGDSMFTFQKRIEDNGDVVDKGLGKIGLSLAGIKDLRPDEQFLAVSDAMRAAGVEVNKSAVGYEIFGKQAKEILPLLLKPLSDLTEESEKLGATWSDRDVAAARAFRGEVTKLGAETEEAWTVLGRTVAPITNEITLGWDKLKLWAVEAIVFIATSGDKLMNLIGVSKDWALASETAAAKQDTINKAIADGAPKTIRYGEAVKYLNEQFEHQKPAADQANDAAQAWLKKLGDGILAASRAAEAQRLLTEGLAEQGIVQGEITDFQAQVETGYEKSATAQAKYRAEVTGTVKADADQVAVLKSLIPGLVVGEATYTRVRDAIAGMVEKGQQVPEFLKNWADANRPVLATTHDFSGYLGELSSRESDASDNMYNLAAAQNEFHDGVTIAGDTISTVTIPLFTTLAHGVLPQMGDAITDATKKTVTFAETIGTNLLDTMKRVPQAIANAFTSGGGVVAGLQSVGSMAGAGIGDAIGKSVSALGKMGGPIGSAIGSLAGPIIGFFANVFSGGAEHMINPVREAYVQAAGGLAALDAKAHDAGMTLTALLNAKNPEQYKKAIDDLNAAFDRQKKFIDDCNTELGGLLKSGQDIGMKLPPSLQPAIQQLIDMGKITGDNAALFATMAGGTEVDFKKMQDVAGKYGMDLANLGPAFQSAKLNDTAKSVINDFDTLTRGGADVDSVLAGMKKPINDIVNESIKFGVAIPENMRPWVEQLEKTGQLTDENGTKITDLSGLKFAEPIVTEFDKIAKKIGDLIDVLTKGLPSAITNIPQPPTIHVPYQYDEQGGGPRGGDNPGNYAAIGGLVTNHGIQYLAGGGNVLAFTPRGTDTVPAMLTPGEGVVTQTGMSALGAGGLRALNRGDRSGGQVINFEALQKEFAAMRRELTAQRAQQADDARRAPERLAIAVAGALATRRGR